MASLFLIPVHFFCSRPISSRTIRYFFVARFMVLAPLLALFYVRSDFQNQNSRAQCQPRFTFRDDDGMPHNINSLSLQHLTCHDVSCFFAYFWSVAVSLSRRLATLSGLFVAEEKLPHAKLELDIIRLVHSQFNDAFFSISNQNQ